MSGPIGILALQGAYAKHGELLDRLGVRWQAVKTAAALDDCAALILPGGESTAMTRLLEPDGLLERLRVFAQGRPVLGTCAGLILMGRSGDARAASLGILDVQVERNAFGRQVWSFQARLDLDLGGEGAEFPATFIRAPRIVQAGAAVEVAGRWRGEPVLVAQGPHLGMSFHPELSGDPRIHAWWLRRIAARTPREGRTVAVS